MEIFAKVTSRSVNSDAIYKLIKWNNKFYWSLLIPNWDNTFFYCCVAKVKPKELHIIDETQLYQQLPPPYYQFSVPKFKTFIPLDHSDLLEENQCNS